MLTGGPGPPWVEQCHGGDCWDRDTPLYCVCLWVLITQAAVWPVTGVGLTDVLVVVVVVVVVEAWRLELTRRSP